MLLQVTALMGVHPFMLFIVTHGARNTSSLESISLLASFFSAVSCKT